MSFTAPIMASNPARIVQIISAGPGWYAHYEDGEQIPIVCWALIDNAGMGMVVGLITQDKQESLLPASAWKPNFVKYFQKH